MHHAPLASHENILDLLGYGWNLQDSIPFLVTECARHGTLRQFLKGNALRPRQKRKLCRDIASGLLELHLCGIAHGDIKLDNVLIVDRGVEPDSSVLDNVGQAREIQSDNVIPKLADFGHSVLLPPEQVTKGDSDQKYRGTIA